jgi:hypothetical protein
LCSWQLRAYHWLGSDQSGQRFVPFAGQQQTCQVAAKFLALIALPKEGIKVLGVGF